MTDAGRARPHCFPALQERQQQMAWSLNVLHKAPYANIILAGA
jgi:hypothetical protein